MKQGKYLDNGFKETIDNPRCSPKEVFDDYGTHLLKNALLGARLSINFTNHQNVFETKDEAEVKINCVLKDVIGANRSTAFSETTKRFIDNSDINISCIGGHYSGELDIHSIPKMYNEWMKSVNDPSFQAICGISNKSDLIPIWEFCKDTNRKKELESYYLAETEKNRNALLKYDTFVTDVKILSASTETEAKNQLKKGYELVSKDLAKNAGGYYTYLAYKLCDGLEVAQDGAYTNFFVEDNSKPQNEDSRIIDSIPYTRFKPTIKDRGLNRYLLGTKKSKDKPIKRLSVRYGKNSFNDKKNSVVRFIKDGTPADSNKGCGGEYIYIEMITD